MDTLLTAVQSGKNCSAACTAFIDSESIGSGAARPPQAPSAVANMVGFVVRMWAGWGRLLAGSGQPPAAQNSRLCARLAGIGIDCLSDAVLKAFNETQPGMMGFSQDTVRQLM